MRAVGGRPGAHLLGDLVGLVVVVDAHMAQIQSQRRFDSPPNLCGKWHAALLGRIDLVRQWRVDGAAFQTDLGAEIRFGRWRA